MTKIHLITHLLCPYVQRSIIVLLEKRVPFTRTDIDLSNKPAWFEHLSPMSKVPILVMDEKKPLFESAVICEYLDEITPGSLHPAEPYEKARHRAWIEFGSTILNAIAGLYSAEDRRSFENKRRELKEKFQQVEKEHSGKQFFSGNQYHLVDAVYGPVFRYFDVFEHFVDLGIFESLPETTGWRETLRTRASHRQAVAPEYETMMFQFLSKRDSYMAGLVTDEQARNKGPLR